MINQWVHDRNQQGQHKLARRRKNILANHLTKYHHTQTYISTIADSVTRSISEDRHENKNVAIYR